MARRIEASVKVGIPETQWLFLLETPLYSPAIMRAETVGTVLLIRVDDLASLREQKPSMSIKFVAWRSKSGTWVTALAFRLIDHQGTFVERFIFLNPRQSSEYALLHDLTRQEVFPIFFLSPALSDIAARPIPWVFSQRQGVSGAIGAIDKALTGEKLNGSADPEFEFAQREFQASHSVKDLLSQPA